MVWNTTQSAFYKAIDAFNNGEKTGGKQPLPPGEINCEKCGNYSPESLSETECENHRCNHDYSRPVKTCTNRCPSCPKYRVSLRQNNNALSELFSDKDMLLIAGLILILSQQNADKKLILALAFVLLT